MSSPLHLGSPPRLPAHEASRSPAKTLRGGVCFLAILASLVSCRGAILGGDVLAGDAPSQAVLELGLRSELERSGDVDGLLEAWLDAVVAAPADFRTELLARRIVESLDDARDPQGLLPRLEAALQAPLENGVTRHILCETLSQLHVDAGKEEEAARLRQADGLLGAWLIIGPFGKESLDPFARRYEPEDSLSLDAVHRDAWQELRWRKVERADSSPFLAPGEHLDPPAGVAYLLCQVRNDSGACDAVLVHSESGPVRIWLNGQLVVEEDPGRSFERRPYTPVRLEAGWNRILVKTAQPFSLRLSDEKGMPFPVGRLVEERERVLHDAPPASGKGSAARAEPASFELGAIPRWRAWIQELAAAGEADGAPPEARRALGDAWLGLAALLSLRNDDPFAIEGLDRALLYLPDDAWTRLHTGRIVRQAAYLPSSIAKSRSQSAFEGALELDPELLPARERVARVLAEDQKSTRALALLDEGLRRSPDWFAGHRRRQAIASSQQWEAQTLESVAAIERLAPRRSLGPELKAALEERDNNPAALASLRRAWERSPGRIDLGVRVARQELGQGRPEAAEGALRRLLAFHPRAALPRAELFQLLQSTGRQEEAAALAREVAASRAFDADAHARLGAALEGLGQGAEALVAFEEALRLDPGNVAVRRRLESGKGPQGVEAPSGLEDAFWTPYDARLEDWIVEVPASGPLVDKAASIIVLDILVARFARDGSLSQYVHQASKVLTEESKDDLANVQTSGEVLLLRTLTPQGESLEPVNVGKGGSFVMPNLAPGVFVEHAYRTDGASRRGRVDMPTFYFQDTSFQQSFLVSRLVVIYPEELELDFLETQIPPADSGAGTGGPELARVEKVERELDDGFKVRIYEARSVPRLVREGAMPASSEYIPNVDVRGKPRPWDEIASTLESSRASATRLTPELRREAAEATRGIEEPLAKARALYDRVNELIPKDSGGSDASQTLLLKAGDRTLLFKALLDAAGVPCRWEFLRPPEAVLPRARWEQPDYTFFQYPHVRLEVGPDPIHLSLGGRFTPFGRLPEQLEGGKALVVSRGAHSIEPLPAGRPEESATSLVGVVKLGEDESVEAELTLEARASAAFSQKDRLKTLQAFERDLVFRQMANGFFPGARVLKADFPGIEERDQPLRIFIAAQAPKALKKSEDSYLFRPILQPLGLVRSFAGRSKREHPFHLRAQRISRDRLRIEPGARFAAGKLPEGLSLACSLGTYVLRYSLQEGSVQVERELTLLPGRLGAREFDEFVGFCEKVDAAERENVSFRKVAAE